MPRKLFKWPLLGQIAAVLFVSVLIAAIIFPLFQKVHEGNHRSCGSNLRLLATAMTQYTQDADEKYPQGTNAAGNGWAGQIYPFIKAARAYHCPNDAQDGKFISYAENRNLAGSTIALENPAATVDLYEFSTLNCDPSTAETVSATGLSAPQDSKRHSGDTSEPTYSLNFLAADGHARLLRPWQVSGGPNAVSAAGLPHQAIAETFAEK